MSPIIVGDEDEFHELVKDVFEQVTQRVSYAKKWCEKFLNFQKISGLLARYPCSLRLSAAALIVNNLLHKSVR